MSGETRMIFTDERGMIRDLLVEPLDSVTQIISVQGAIRGNHYHAETVQWTLVQSGQLRVVTPREEKLLNPGDMWRDDPGVPHAWQAVTACTVLVFTRGPRSGAAYESDTFRLEKPLICA